MEKRIKNVIEVPNTGKKVWYGGAYTLAFVYSNKGNFICKGFHLEVEQYILDLKSKGYKYFVNYTLWSSKYGKQHRSIWRFHTDGIYICRPEQDRQGYKRISKWKPWRVTNFKDIDLKFKRLPKRWIPEFNTI